MQALEAEGLKKELQEAQAAAAKVQADLSAQLNSQSMLSKSLKEQCTAAQLELTALQVNSWGESLESIGCVSTAMLPSGQAGRSHGLSSARGLSSCGVAGGACC